MSDLQCPARIVFVCIDPPAPESAYDDVLPVLRGDRFTGAWTAPEHLALAERLTASLGVGVRADEEFSEATGNRWRISTVIGDIADQTRGEGTLVLASAPVIAQATLSCPNVTPDLTDSEPLRPGIRVEVSIDSDGWWCRAWGAS